MIEYLNDSGFLFSSYKYDPDKRTSIVISFKSTEPFIEKYSDINAILYNINNYYKEKCNDVCPYHYIITEDGICHNIKSPELTLPNNECRLSEYDNDIKVLVMKERAGKLNETMVNTIINLIARDSEEYALFITDTVFFQDTLENYVTDNEMEQRIIMESILKRNSNNSLFCILEHVVNNKQIIINDKVVAIPPITDELTLADIATKYSIPLSILENLNPHIKDSKTLDVVFIPNIYALKYKREAVKILKSIYVNCFDLAVMKGEIDNGL